MAREQVRDAGGALDFASAVVTQEWGTARVRDGNKNLKRVLVQAAHAAARTKDSYFSTQYHRLAARRGKKRAAVAVGRSILETAFHMIQRGTTYQDLGADYFDRRDPAKLAKGLAQRMARLGYKVTYEPTGQPSHYCRTTCEPINLDAKALSA